LGRTPYVPLFTKVVIEDAECEATGLKIGAAYSAALRAHVDRIAREDSSTHLQMVVAPDQEVALPDVSDLGTQAKIVSAIAKWLLRPDRYRITQSLHDIRGGGCTLTLSGPGSPVRQSTTLWTDMSGPKIKDDSAPYFRLAPRAAAWTLFGLRAATPRMVPNLVQALGTDDWQAYSLFLEGVQAQLEGNDDLARALYLESLSRDLEFLPAMLNLAFSESLSDDREELRRALTRMSFLLAQLENE
jgi:hypothetical protein